MKIKDGLLALAVAAALSTSGAFAQNNVHQPGPDTPEEPHDQSGKAASPLDSSDSVATGSESDMQQSADASSSSMSQDSSTQQEQSASAGASISDDQRARAGEPLSSSMSSDSDSMSTMSQAQSDVPPPVDSETVRNIQQALNDQGHQIQVDGIWGEKTHQALMDFQREQNMDASGQLDGETFAALNLTEETQTASASSQDEPPQQTASAEATSDSDSQSGSGQ